jgi:peptidoglycan/LPS O-acetylase OafA/YrhL
MKYFKQLDSVRALAVILVMLSHWIPKDNLINKIPNGSIGVDVFFVLSGFLISRILFENRNKADRDNITKSVVFRDFYIRRALRIFPIYYLLILLILIFILNNKVLLFMGRISYGLYLYHNPIRALNFATINKYLNPMLPDWLWKTNWKYLFLAENLALTVLVSWLSFVLIEKRFLNLKKYFEYKGSDEQSEAQLLYLQPQPLQNEKI